MTESQEVLGAELAQQSNEEIAKALVNAPPRTDIARSGVQNQIINTDNDPQRWADICNLALKTSQSSTERKIFLKLERINGIRRVKNIYLCALQRGLNQLIHEIDQLPDNEWKIGSRDYGRIMAQLCMKLFANMPNLQLAMISRQA